MCTQKNVKEEYLLNTEPKEIINCIVNELGFNYKMPDDMRESLTELVGFYQNYIRKKNENVHMTAEESKEIWSRHRRP